MSSLPKIEAAIYRVRNPDRLEDECNDMEEALLACIEIGGEVGLKYVLELFDYDYHNWVPFSKDFQRVAALTTVYWERIGLESLTQVAIDAYEFRGEVVVLELLACAASLSLSSLDKLLLVNFPNLRLRLDLSGNKYVAPDFVNAAKRALVNFAINTSLQEQVPQNLMSALGYLGTFEPLGFNSAFGVLLSAFHYRWFHLSDHTLQGYEKLIRSSSVTEEDIHKYLNSHPQLLDPFFAKIWSKPQLGEKLIADFMIRLMDDEYIVVEIEKPSDQLMTTNGNLSAKANHAVRQALEYRDWLISNLLYSRQTFENLWRPTCLVVIGLESELNDIQKLRLKQEKESRHGNVRIVGFDWLHKRAISVLNNLINQSIDRFLINTG